MRAWKRVVVALVACLVPAGVSVVAAPAAQAGTATISRSIYLVTPSTGRAYLPPDGPRAIYLAAGNYRWTLLLGVVGPTRDLYLPAGWYNWRCYLDGTGSTSVSYTSNCLLDPHAAGQPNEWLPDGAAFWWGYPTGTYTWKNTLTSI